MSFLNTETLSSLRHAAWKLALFKLYLLSTLFKMHPYYFILFIFTLYSYSLNTVCLKEMLETLWVTVSRSCRFNTQDILTSTRLFYGHTAQHIIISLFLSFKISFQRFQLKQAISSQASQSWWKHFIWYCLVFATSGSVWKFYQKIVYCTQFSFS